MNLSRTLLVLGLITVSVRPAPAGVFFGKHAKPNPAERVPQLLAIVKTDADESKRTSAARELRDFDPSAFPAIVPVLTDVLKHDPQAGVRVEVVQTLGKLRPISTQAGLALEDALNDASWRVRWQARQTLMLYRVSGYRSPAKPEENPPPVAKSASNASSPPVLHGAVPRLPKGRPNLVPKDTPPPPLADPAPVRAPELSKPLPLPTEDGPDLPIGK